MNEKLQVALADLVNKSVGALGKGTEFLAGEIPDVIRQLLIWKAVESAIWFGLGILLLIAMIYGNYRQIKWIRSWLGKPCPGHYYKDLGLELCDRPELMLNFFQLLPGAVILSLLSNLDWLKIWIAPKVYLIEYAASMVKGH